MAEIDFWRERTAILSAVSEQLKLPVVKKILEVMVRADPVTVQNLDLTVTELAKHHVESVENVRFLSTLERHFKVGQTSSTIAPCWPLREQHGDSGDTAAFQNGFIDGVVRIQMKCNECGPLDLLSLSVV